MITAGSKLQVYNGTAKHTAGGLTKSDLMKSPRTGKIISKKQHANGMKQARHLGIAVRKSKRTAKGSGIFSSLFGSIGLGVPAKKRKVAKKAKKITGGKLKKKGARKGARKGGRKQKGSGDAWDSFKTGFMAPVNLARMALPFL